MLLTAEAAAFFFFDSDISLEMLDLKKFLKIEF